MSTVEQADPVQGITPTLLKLNSQDGPQPGIEYVSSESPLNVEGMSNVSGSFTEIITKKINWPIVLLVTAAVGGVAYLIYGDEFKKVRKHAKAVKTHKK